MKRYYHLLADDLTFSLAKQVVKELEANRKIYWTSGTHYEVLAGPGSDVASVFAASEDQERPANVEAASTFVDGILAGIGSSIERVEQLENRIAELEQAALAAKE